MYFAALVLLALNIRLNQALPYFQPTKSLLALKDSDFEPITQSYDDSMKLGWLILFYNNTSPCEFCEQAYESLKLISPNFNSTKFAVIESEVAPETFRRFRLKEKSELIFIRKARYYQYRKEFTPERLSQYIEEKEWRTQMFYHVKDHWALRQQVVKFMHKLFKRWPKKYPQYYIGGGIGIAVILSRVVYLLCTRRQKVKDE